MTTLTLSPALAQRATARLASDPRAWRTAKAPDPTPASASPPVDDPVAIVPSKQHQIAEMLAARAWLFSAFPETFNFAFRPLKIGIGKDLIPLLPEDVPPSAMKAALWSHTSTIAYLRNTAAAGAMRHDLSGNPIEPVSDHDREHAASLISERKKARHKREEAAPAEHDLDTS